MGTLTSKTLTRIPKVRTRLQQCANDHAFNIHQGHDAIGDHVSQIHAALVALVPNHGISEKETETGTYGNTTALAVERFKSDAKLNGTGGAILGPGQTKVDRIVGIQTIAALDRQLRIAENPLIPPEPTPPPKPLGKFTFLPVNMPLLIKSRSDDVAKQDMEATRVNRLAIRTRARVLASDLPNGFTNVGPTVSRCMTKLRLFTGIGGHQAREMAEFFFNNNHPPTSPRPARVFSEGHFWVNEVRKDPSFTTNHKNLTAAIEAGLQELTDAQAEGGKTIDVNRLAVDPADPTKGNPRCPRSFDAFPNDIDFSFQRDPKRLAAGDPLAFGFGRIQGLHIRMTDFVGQPNGSYRGVLQYVLIDHYGADDGDVIDPGQASLWLLQRKMADDQGTLGFDPYRSQIIVDNVVFTGKLH